MVGLNSIFLHVLFYRDHAFHQHCRSEKTLRARASRVLNTNIWRGSISVISSVVSWLAGSACHSIVCIYSFFGVARSKSRLVRFSRHIRSSKTACPSNVLVAETLIKFR